MKIRDAKTKQLFIKYLEEHPKERFMQAVRNFINVPFLVVFGDVPNEGDTFYWECDKMLYEEDGITTLRPKDISPSWQKIIDEIDKELKKNETRIRN